MKSNIISLIVSLFIAFILWYIILPPINLSSPLFWLYLGILLVIVCLTFGLNSKEKARDFNDIIIGKKKVNSKCGKYFKAFAVYCSIIVIILILDFIASPLFNASKYASRIVVDETHTFTEDISQVDFTKIPLLDKDSSSKLGDRILGQATEWVSQYYVSDLYTQINYNDEIIRVTPIEYAGLIKYFANHTQGIKGYITVNSVDGSANLVTLDKGMHYMPSAYFFENLSRKLRISYPTEIFDDASFEIDNDGNPYWIVPTVKYTMVGLRKEISGVVILNAITGESKKYELSEIPTWVDHVYSAELVLEQMNNWGEYKEGFLNSIFGQKNVVNTTEGYTYLVLDDDVYLYTGITSVSTDESNLGFVLINLRTKETRYYITPGAEEYSAMASAEGLVQEKGYIASFPLLINLNNKATYLLSLKDNAGLVKMYAFVDVADYQKVVVSDASLGIEAAAKKYLGESLDEETVTDTIDTTITVKSITNAVIDSNTFYYITDSNDLLYTASIKVDKNILPFIKVNDKIKITYSSTTVNKIVSIELIK
jgi:hypothetical protein